MITTPQVKLSPNGDSQKTTRDDYVKVVRTAFHQAK